MYWIGKTARFLVLLVLVCTTQCNTALGSMDWWYCGDHGKSVDRRICSGTPMSSGNGLPAADDDKCIIQFSNWIIISIIIHLPTIKLPQRITPRLTYLCFKKVPHAFLLAAFLKLSGPSALPGFFFVESNLSGLLCQLHDPLADTFWDFSLKIINVYVQFFTTIAWNQRCVFQSLCTYKLS